MQQRGLARTGLAGDEGVLGRPPAERERLPAGRPGPADRHLEPLGGARPPLLARLRGDVLERHLDPHRFLARLPDPLNERRDGRRLGRAVERQRERGQGRVFRGELAVPPVQDERGRLQVGQPEVAGHLGLGVHADQRADPAGRAALGDADQPLGRLRGEVGREVGDDQHPVRLGHLAGRPVVLLDGRVLVPQVLLDDAGDVVGQVGEAGFDLPRLGPDLAGDELLVEVGQVHEGGEVLAQADGVEHGEPDLPGRQPGDEPEHHRLEGFDRPGPAVVPGLQHHRAAVRERQERRDRPGQLGRRGQPRVGRHHVRDGRRVEGVVPVPDPGRHFER